VFDWQLATDHWQLFLQQLRHIFFVEVDRQHVVELLAVGILAPEVLAIPGMFKRGRRVPMAAMWTGPDWDCLRTARALVSWHGESYLWGVLEPERVRGKEKAPGDVRYSFPGESERGSEP